MNEITRNDSVSVGTTAVQIAFHNESRKMIYLRNNSTGGQIITLVFSDSLTASVGGGGIVLSPGDFITDSDSNEYQCWKGNISGIASAGGGVLTLYER